MQNLWAYARGKADKTGYKNASLCPPSVFFIIVLNIIENINLNIQSAKTSLQASHPMLLYVHRRYTYARS